MRVAGAGRIRRGLRLAANGRFVPCYKPMNCVENSVCRWRWFGRRRAADAGLPVMMHSPARLEVDWRAGRRRVSGLRVVAARRDAMRGGRAARLGEGQGRVSYSSP